MGYDFDDNRLPATRRGVRWLFVVVAVAALLDGLGPLLADGGLLTDRTGIDVALTTVALSLPWLVAAGLLRHRPRLATGMAVAAALVLLPRQLWQLWLHGNELAARGLPLYPELLPRTVIVVLVVVTLWLAYLSRPRGHWEGKATSMTRRALVPLVMALLWTIGPVADPVPTTGQESGVLLPHYLGDPLNDLDAVLFVLLQALPVLVVAVAAMSKHRRITGAGLMVYGATMFLLVLADYLRGLALYESSLLPLGGVAFLGLVSLVVIGHQWATEGARFADPGKVPEHPGRSVDPDELEGSAGQRA